MVILIQCLIFLWTSFQGKSSKKVITIIKAIWEIFLNYRNVCFILSSSWWMQRVWKQRKNVIIWIPYCEMKHIRNTICIYSMLNTYEKNITWNDRKLFPNSAAVSSSTKHFSVFQVIAWPTTWLCSDPVSALISSLSNNSWELFSFS